MSGLVLMGLLMLIGALLMLIGCVLAIFPGRRTVFAKGRRPAGLARLMLLELEEEHLHGGPRHD
jgi:hypothetical protein